MWAPLSCNSRNGVVLISAACSKPTHGLVMETRQFGEKVDLRFLGSTRMHFVYLLKPSPNLSRWGCHYLVKPIRCPGLGRNKVLLSWNVCFYHQASPSWATGTHMFFPRWTSTALYRMLTENGGLFTNPSPWALTAWTKGYLLNFV